MDALRCPPPDADVTVLSGGERRRVALCKLLLQQPDLLLLDEPTNHLDAESVQWLEQHLAKYAGTVLAVTHDRYFLDNVAQWILELDRGRAYPYEGNYSTYLETKQTRLKVEGRKDEKRAKRLKDELEWVRSNAKARQTKSKARLERYEEMAAEAEKTRKLDFEEIQIPPGPRLGNVVVEVDDLTKGFDDRVLIDDLSFTLPRNGIVGVIGPNGVGKTTLFKMIVGEEKPDGGTIKVGETVQLSYVDQSRGGIDPKKTVWEVVSDGLDHIKVGHVEMPSRAYVSAFGFKGPDQQKPAGVLSGGERNRLNLALTLKNGGNLLLLDEPTNDLDVETLSSLENALLEFPGCAVVISHDRWFLDRVATHILAWEGDAQVVLVRGQLRVLREEQDRAARRRRGPPAPGDLPQAHPRLTQRERTRAARARDPAALVGRRPAGPSVPRPAARPDRGRSAGRRVLRDVRLRRRVVATDQRRGAAALVDVPRGGSMRHKFRCAMRWSDMDAYGHVNNVVYLTYLEESRVDMLFALDSESGAKALSQGVLVAAHEIKYKRPLVYHPRGVDIELWVGAIKGASFEIRYEVHDEDTLFATASSVLVPYDLVAERPRRVSPRERAFLEQFVEDA